MVSLLVCTPEFEGSLSELAFEMEFEDAAGFVGVALPYAASRLDVEATVLFADGVENPHQTGSPKSVADSNGPSAWSEWAEARAGLSSFDRDQHFSKAFAGRTPF